MWVSFKSGGQEYQKQLKFSFARFRIPTTAELMTGNITSFGKDEGFVTENKILSGKNEYHKLSG